MSIYNNERTLKSSINSILEQTYQDFELLIMDDNSTDKSYDILKEYESKDSRIRIFRNEKNLGLTKSLNILIANSQGDFIARQDGDDKSHKLRFQNQIKYLTEDNYDFSVTRAKIIQSDSLIPKLTYFLPKKQIIKFKNPFIHGTLIIKKETLLEIGCYDENFYYAQDYKLFTDLLKNNLKFKYLKTPLYYLNSEGNISNINKKEQGYYAKCVKQNQVPNLIK